MAGETGHAHETIVCGKCGTIVMQCRCMEGGQKVREIPGPCGVGNCTQTFLPRVVKMFPREYPGRGQPWADFFHHRARVLTQLVLEGKSVEYMIEVMTVDRDEVSKIISGPPDPIAVTESSINDFSANTWRNGLKEAVERMREHLGSIQLRFDARDKLALRFILAQLEGK